MSSVSPKEPYFKSVPKPVLSHFGICVSNLEKSANFYCEVFGYSRGARFCVGPEISHLTGLENCHLEIQMVFKEWQLIELIQCISPGTIGPAEPRPMNQLGVTHLNFRVDDIDAVGALVVEHGGKIMAETRHEAPARPDSPAGAEGHINKMVYVTDPDGTRIEIMDISDSDRFDVSWT